MAALAKARERLAARIRDPKLLMVPGLQDDLRAIVGALDELELRTATLAAFALRKHYWPLSQVHPGQLKALIEMGTDPATVARVATHGERCTCYECMGAG